MSAIPAHELPINLVKIVGFEDNRGDNALTTGSLHDDADRPKEDVELRLDRGGIALLGNGELSSIAAVGESSGSDVEGVGDGFRGIKDKVVTDSQCGVGGAGRIEGIAEGPGLGEGRRDEES